jgi:SagB-type dehydrogenase family enzyme
MKKMFPVAFLIGALLLVPILGMGQAQDLMTIKLLEPNKERGLHFMKALSVRASVREWSDKELGLQDLSDLLWAANGINRPDGRKTASSAMNAQDVDIFVFMKAGAYLYDAAAHALVPVLAGDHRSELMMMRPGGPGGPGGPQSQAPIQIILVSDISRFRMGEPALKLEWAAIDTGIVSQNISVFCAATGLGTRPRGSMSKEKIKELLKLSDTQYPLLNHPVGYLK